MFFDRFSTGATVGPMQGTRGKVVAIESTKDEVGGCLAEASTTTQAHIVRKAVVEAIWMAPL